jgi:hypothetical protein
MLEIPRIKFVVAVEILQGRVCRSHTNVGSGAQFPPELAGEPEGATESTSSFSFSR